MLEIIIEHLKEISANIGLKSIIATPFLLLSSLGLELYAFFILITLDTITGTIYAMKNQNFSSRRFKDSVFKFFTYFLIITASTFFEMTFSSLWVTNTITLFIIVVISVTEFSSIMENLIGLGVPLPKREILAVFIRNVKYKNIGNIIKFSEKRTKIEREVDALIGKYLNLISSEKLRELVRIRMELHINCVLNEILLNGDFNNPSSELLKINMNIKGVRKSANDIWGRKFPKSDKEIKFLNKIFDHRYPLMLKDIEKVVLDNNSNIEQKKYLTIEIITKHLYSLINEIMIGEDKIKQ